VPYRTSLEQHGEEMENWKQDTGNWKPGNVPVFHLRFAVSCFPFASVRFRLCWVTTCTAFVAALAGLLLTACSPKLPEPESPGAQLYKDRCDSCHRVFAPSSLKYEMWKVQVDRMQGEMARRGVPPLTTEERATVLEYLKRHSG
jgi:hypothetical protein